MSPEAWPAWGLLSLQDSSSGAEPHGTTSLPLFPEQNRIKQWLIGNPSWRQDLRGFLGWGVAEKTKKEVVGAWSSLPFPDDPLPSRDQFDILDKLLSNIYHTANSIQPKVKRKRKVKTKRIDLTFFRILLCAQWAKRYFTYGVYWPFLHSRV